MRKLSLPAWVAGLTGCPRYYADMGARNGRVPDPRTCQRHNRWSLMSCASESRTVSGRSTCATAPPTPQSTWPAVLGIALGEQFSTYLGWLIPWGTPLILIDDSAEQVAGAPRQLVRIGIDRPTGAAIGAPASSRPGTNCAPTGGRPSPTSPRSTLTGQIPARASPPKQRRVRDR
jgi:hydroxyacylglutathione hydrolase